MFDYQAGEKYKLTLIMVAIAGMLAGVFFTVLLMPSPEAPQGKRKRQVSEAVANNPDVTGRVQMPPDAQGMPQQQAQVLATNPIDARNLIQGWLPLAWDLSAYSAKASQEKALSCMTSECRDAYTQNIWTPQIAQQIEQSGVQSHFETKKIEPGEMKADGSVEVLVEGEQTLSVPGKGGKTRGVKVLYLVKNMPEGLRIAGISEAGQTQ